MNSKYLIALGVLITLSTASSWAAFFQKRHIAYASMPLKKITAYDNIKKKNQLIPAATPATLMRHDISDDTIEPIASAAAQATLTFHDILESDTFEHTINFLDQKTLMRMLQVNTKCNQVMKNIMARTCSQLIQQHQGDLSQALFTAIENNMLYAVNYLIQNRANVNAQNANGCTALILATNRNNEPVVTKLLESKADIEAIDPNGCTALILATDRNNAPIVTQLLESKADIEATDPNGCTALMLAVDHNHKAIVTQLLKSKANIEATDFNGRTALMIATDRNYAAIATQLANSLEAKEYIKNRNVCICLAPCILILIAIMLPIVNHFQIITNSTHYYDE